MCLEWPWKCTQGCSQKKTSPGEVGNRADASFNFICVFASSFNDTHKEEDVGL